MGPKEIEEFINKLYKKYKMYINLSQNEFTDMLKCELIKIYEKELNENDNKNYVKMKLNDYLIKYICDLFLDSEYFINTFLKYLKDNISKKDSYSKNFRELEKICNFFNRINFFPDADVIINIIKLNSDLNDILKCVVEKNIKEINEGFIYDMFDNDIIYSFIEAYCIFNDIDINITMNINNNEKLNDETYDIDNKYIIDGINNNKNLSDDAELNFENLIVKKIVNTPLLTFKEERDLLIRVSQGDRKARKILIERNLRLVLSWTYKYSGYCKNGLKFEDLFQEGTIGLIKAIDKYDINKGYKLSTYSVHWIRQTMTRSFCNKSRIIRIPVNKYDEIEKFKRAQDDLISSLKREPSIYDIAKKLKKSVDKVSNFQTIINDAVSINTSIDEDGTELEEIIEDSNLNVENSIVDNSLKGKMEELYRKVQLTEEEIIVLSYRYGLYDREILSREKIGKLPEFNVSRERIRQIEDKAIRKLTFSGNIKNLAVYLGDKQKALESLEEKRKAYFKG